MSTDAKEVLADLELILKNGDYLFLGFWLLVWLPTTHPIAAMALLVFLFRVMKEQWWDARP